MLSRVLLPTRGWGLGGGGLGGGRGGSKRVGDSSFSAVLSKQTCDRALWKGQVQMDTPSISRDSGQPTSPPLLFPGLGGPLLAALLISSVSAFKAGSVVSSHRLGWGPLCLISVGPINSAKCASNPCWLCPVLLDVPQVF